jgi:hypothetical protein
MVNVVMVKPSLSKCLATAAAIAQLIPNTK